MASTASSASAGAPEHADLTHVHVPASTDVAPPRHRRSSSSTSVRSRPGIASSAGWSTAAAVGSTASGHGTQHHAHTTTPSQASIERARETVSRQNSITSQRRSGASSPAHPSVSHPDTFPQQHHHHHQPHHRQSLSSSHHTQATTSPTASGFAIPRYEEVAQHRAELEAAKRENELLKRRIRELERVVSARRRSVSEAGDGMGPGGGGGGVDARAPESSSASNPGTEEGRSNGKDTGGNHGVKVGESASSVGFGDEA